MSSAPGTGSETANLVAAFCALQYEASGAAKFDIDRETFVAIVGKVVERWNGAATPDETRKFLETLRVDELVLTRACAAGHNAAWDKFLNRYRATLYSAAHQIAHDETNARELADSLYAELYGISETGTARVCKLLYFSGRGSLEGWLRTVVAQEYVNRYRRTRRETSLDGAVEEGKQFPAAPSPPPPLADGRIDEAIAAEISALEDEERLLLASYYLDGRKLAEIGRMLRVHESTISRKLEKTTATVRKRIRKRLIDQGMFPREVDERMQELDVRDVDAPIGKSLRQEAGGPTFYEGREL